MRSSTTSTPSEPTGAHPAPVLDSMLCFSVYRLERRIGGIYRELLAPWRLSYTQYLALIALWQEDGIAVGRLGALLGLDSGTLSPLLKRMESRGLLRRRRTDDDERIVRVRLTAAGRRLQDETAAVPACFAKRLGVTRPQADALIAQVDRLGETAMEGTAS